MPLPRRTDDNRIFPVADNKTGRPHAFAYYETVSAVPAEWDHLVQGHSVFLRREYLQLLEEHGPPAVKPFYAIVSENDRPVAVVKVNIFDVDDEMLSVRDRTTYNAGLRPVRPFLDRNLTRLRNMSLGMFGRRIVLCGNLFSCGMHGVAFGRGEDPERLWPAVTTCLQNILQSEGTAAYLAVKDVTPLEPGITSSLAAAGFSPLRLEPSMDLHLPETWRTYADYIDSLNTKYRKAANKIEEAIDRAGMRIESLPDPAVVQDRLFSLYVQVEHRARIRFGMLQEGYLPALARMAGPDGFRCSVVRNHEEIVGFSAVFRDGNTAVVHLVGFDYEANSRAPIYLRLLLRSIEDGLALGCKVVHFGRTALEPKARLGATPARTEAWVRHSNPLVNRTVGWLLRLVTEDAAPQRTPFRSGKGEGEYSGLGTTNME